MLLLLLYLQVTTGVASINLGRAPPAVAPKPGQRYEDLENLPPPPPELLQQQYLYGNVPDSRQQATFGNVAPSRGQGTTVFLPGKGEATVPQAQQAQISNIPPSKPIQVEKRTMGQSPPQAPNSFTLIPVRVENEQTPEPAPAPRSQPKPTLDAMDKDVLQSVDDHAIQVSPPQGE